MKWKDATRSFGSVGFLLSVLLILIISAGTANACPKHGAKVQRVKSVHAMPHMRTTLITYGGPAYYGRCESAYRTRDVRYVATRDNGYYGYAPRYAAVRNVKVRGYYPMGKTRYIAVRNDDYGYAPRYVTMRRQPVYVDDGYVVMRNKAPRTRYVAVRDYDRDYYADDYYAPRYVAVRRYPVQNKRYVAVRDLDNGYDARHARYVAVRNGRAFSDLDDFETESAMRHVVVKSDFIDGTEEVIYANDASYEDTAYMDFPERTYKRHVSYANRWSDDSYTPTRYVAAKAVRYVTTYYDEEADDFATDINYVPTYYDSEVEDQAILDTSEAAFVAFDDIGNACLMPVARRASPVIKRTRAVNYVPARVVTHRAVPTVRYVSVVEDDFDVVDADTGYVTETDQFADTSTTFVEETGSGPVWNMSNTGTLAGANGYRDGFEEGREDVKDGNGFEPTNSGNSGTVTTATRESSAIRTTTLTRTGNLI